MRVYVPATLAMLQQFVAAGSLRPVNGIAFAVTPMLREAYAEDDDDELGEVALQEAALASLRLLAATAHESVVVMFPARRVVVVADADDVRCQPGLDDAVVNLTESVAMDRLVAAYVDHEAAEPAVFAAIDAVEAADLGHQDAALTVGGAQDHDLVRYAPEEVPFLLELL